MDNSNYDQIIADLEASPGIIAGTVMVLIALYLFSAYARAKMKHRLAQMVWAGVCVGAVICGWSYLTTHLV
jgi:hypothetical protein